MFETCTCCTSACRTSLTSCPHRISLCARCSRFRWLTGSEDQLPLEYSGTADPNLRRRTISPSLAISGTWLPRRTMRMRPPGLRRSDRPTCSMHISMMWKVSRPCLPDFAAYSIFGTNPYSQFITDNVTVSIGSRWNDHHHVCPPWNGLSNL